MRRNVVARKIGRVLSVGIGAFVLFSDEALQFLVDLPLALNYLVASVVVGTLAAAGAVFVLWPRAQPYRQGFQGFLKQVREVIFTFAFVGLAKEFYRLAVALLPFYSHWGTWVVLVLYGGLVVDVWFMRNPIRFGRSLAKVLGVRGP